MRPNGFAVWAQVKISTCCENLSSAEYHEEEEEDEKSSFVDLASKRLRRLDAGKKKKSARLPSTKVALEDTNADFITERKVTEAIGAFGDFKGPGPDGIMPCVLKHLGPNAIHRLTSLYKASLLLWSRARGLAACEGDFHPQTRKDFIFGSPSVETNYTLFVPHEGNGASDSVAGQ